MTTQSIPCPQQRPHGNQLQHFQLPHAHRKPDHHTATDDGQTAGTSRSSQQSKRKDPIQKQRQKQVDVVCQRRRTCQPDHRRDYNCGWLWLRECKCLLGREKDRCVPITGKPRVRRSAFHQIVQALNNGTVVIIFSRTGRYPPGSRHTGAMVQTANAVSIRSGSPRRITARFTSSAPAAISITGEPGWRPAPASPGNLNFHLWQVFRNRSRHFENGSSNHRWTRMNTD